MNVTEMKNLVMIQTNNDTTDIADYATEVLEYLNEGYQRLHYRHVESYPTSLALDADVPALPEQMHRYIVDWATWRFYMNGNQSKQQRGLPFRNSFEEFYNKLPQGGGITDPAALAERASAKRFANLYTDYVAGY